MTSVQEEQGSVNPNPGPSKQLSALAPHLSTPPVMGMQPHLSCEDADRWYHFYHPEPESLHGRNSNLNDLNGSHKFNINKPSAFSGKYGELHPWLTQVSAYLALNSHVYKTDHVKIGLALSYMTGVAAMFTSNYISKFVDGWDDTYPDTWQSFKETLYATFKAGDQKAQAVIKLKSVTQGNQPLESYTAKFLGLFNQAGLLSTSIKEEWVHAAGEVYTSQISKDIYNKPANTPHHPNLFMFLKPAKDPNAMDVDRNQQSLHRRNVQAVTCYNCGKEGHIKQECREKSSIPKLSIKHTEHSTYEIDPKVAKDILHKSTGEKSEEKVFEVPKQASKDF
ncbi:hypothetical protein PISMIDRAFT_16927 [Pisolithus microcarpus 441]|uniref:CCHC-type domain-containing protein n=1 Tax=Pisolithus microcarpus 441 TaxID=765257 RepID=A0A0C9Z4J1_9AGAM|nr:hypothetical protein PISMIDRAFT_16927 [Pisolithus microcarpus 441]